VEGQALLAGLLETLTGGAVGDTGMCAPSFFLLFSPFHFLFLTSVSFFCLSKVRV
jgi:hypothetical protein